MWFTRPGIASIFAAEVRNPPRVVDVERQADHVLVHDLVGRGDHPVDRDRAVRVAEEPVELVPLDVTVVSSAAAALGALEIPGSSQKMNDADRGEDQDRDDGPDDLEPGRAVDLGPSAVRDALAAPVLDDEQDEDALDAEEDRVR